MSYSVLEPVSWLRMENEKQGMVEGLEGMFGGGGILAGCAQTAAD